MFAAVFGACALAALALAVLVRPFVPRLLERVESSVRSEGERTASEVKEFASRHEQSECVPESFRRLARCGGFWCQVSAPVFTRGCLQAASRSPDLCDEVPRSQVRAAIWPTQKCLTTDAEPQICRRIYTELVLACAHS